MKIMGYTVLDLDGDGQTEVVLSVIGVAGDMSGSLILHRIGNRIYGYPVDYRTLMDLKADGTYSYSDSIVTAEGGICSITGFTETGYTIDKITYGKGTYAGWDTFVVNHRPATEEEFFAAEQTQRDKPDAAWYDFASLADMGNNIPKASPQPTEDITLQLPEPETNNTLGDLYAFHVQVSGGRELTVVLDTPRPQDNYFAIDRILVYEGDNLLQTIETASVPRPDGYAWDGLYVNRGYSVGEPDIRDLNFDGSQDFGLLAVSAYPHNVPYSYFLWNAAAGRFDYGFTLFGSGCLETDAEKGQLIEHSHDVLGEYTAIYKYAANGALQKQ